MMGNIWLLIFSFLFICIATIYIYKKWPDLDLIDLYIVFVALHFGFYPFIRGLHFGSDVIFDFRNSNPLPLLLVFLQVLVILVIIRAGAFYFSDNFKNYLKIKYLLQQWGKVNKYFVLLVYFWLIFFQIYSYLKYGVTTYILPDDFARIGKTLPYWFTSMRTVYPYAALIVFLGLFANVVKSRGYQQYLWILLTIIFAPIVALYGRRFLLNILVLSVMFWFIYKKEDIFRLKYITVGLVTIAVFFIFSNVYQTYRFKVFITEGPVQWSKLPNPFTAALNFSSTLNNLKARPGTWEFNFLVINHQLNEPGMTTDGKITWEHFKSAIPRFFWPNKHFTLIDKVLGKLYHVKPESTDIGKNIFGIGQVDFGYFSLIIVPGIVLLLFIILAGLIKISQHYPTFLLLFSGTILFYLISIEESGNELFLMSRYILILLFFFGLYVGGDHLFTNFVKKRKVVYN